MVFQHKKAAEATNDEFYIAKKTATVAVAAM